mgnify:CR=1 FL=1
MLSGYGGGEGGESVILICSSERLGRRTAEGAEGRTSEHPLLHLHHFRVGTPHRLLVLLHLLEIPLVILVREGDGNMRWLGAVDRLQLHA